MKSKFIGFLVFIPLIIGLIYIFLNQKYMQHNKIIVCADGEVIFEPSECKPFAIQRRDLDPNEFDAIYLEENETNYVKSEGDIKIKIELKTDERIWMIIDAVNSPNPDFSEFPTLGFLYYKVVPREYYSGNHNDKNLKLQLMKNDIYLFKFTAPEIPGNYDIHFTDPWRSIGGKDFNLTVIKRVEEEDLVYRITDRFIFSKLDYNYNIRDWQGVSKNIISKNNKWEIDLEIEFYNCGVDWKSDACKKKSVKGHYLIDQKTGLIIG